MMEASEKKKIISGFSWKFAERISSQGVSFILSVVLARLLLPQEYGTIAMVQVFITIANVFVTSGFNTALIQKKDADNLDYSTMLYCSLAMSLAFYGIIYATAPLISAFYHVPELTTITRVYALSLILYSYNSIQNAWVSRHMIFKKFFFSTLSGTFASGVVGIVLAYQGFGVWALVAQAMTNTFVNMIVMRFIIDWRPQLIFSWERAKKLMDYGGKVLGANLLGTFFNQMKQLLIGKMYTPADLAFFDRGNQLPQMISTNIDSTIGSVLFPAMSNHSDNPEAIKNFTRQSIRLSSYVMFFFMTTFAIIAEPVIHFLLTDKWLGCVPFLQIICIGNMISTVSTTNMQAIKAIGRGDILLKLEIAKKPVFFISLVIAASISVKAIAWSIPIYAIYAGYVNMSPNKKLLGYKIREQLADLAPATLLSTVMFGLATPIELIGLDALPTMLIQIAACFVVYLGLSAIFKVQTFNYCLENLKKVLKKKK